MHPKANHMAALVSLATAVPPHLFHQDQILQAARTVMYFAQVKTPSESTKPWDYYKILGTIPGDQAFRSLADSGCPLVAR